MALSAVVITARSSEFRQRRRVLRDAGDALDLDQPVRAADGAAQDQQRQVREPLGEIAGDGGMIGRVAQIDDQMRQVVERAAARSQQRLDILQRALRAAAARRRDAPPRPARRCWRCRRSE